MSRIKDLYAIENGIDDLMPTETVAELINKRTKILVDIIELVDSLMMADLGVIKDNMRKDAEYGAIRDDEYEEVIIENYQELCTAYADEYLMKAIEDQHLDLDYKEYEHIVEKCGEFIADALSDYRCELCKEVEC